MLVHSRSIKQIYPKRYIWAAATTALCKAAFGGSTQSCSTITTSTTKMPPASYPLINKWRQSSDSWLLRFALPSDQKYLGIDPKLPTCISVQHNRTLLDEEGNLVGLLKKSYSPVTHPATVGTFDLLVKSYPPQPGGGVGGAICNLQIGQAIVGKLKAERLVHGSPAINKRWDRIGLIAGGTGIAPLLQLIRIIIEDPEDATKIYLLSVNRYEEDILMREELDKLAREHPDRLIVNYSLTGPNIRNDWEGYRGRGSVEMAKQTLPQPSAVDGKSTMVFVCGMDGFRDMWAGPIARAPPLPDGSKGPKIQGPLLGIMKDAGYDASNVFKY